MEHMLWWKQAGLMLDFKDSDELAKTTDLGVLWKHHQLGNKSTLSFCMSCMSFCTVIDEALVLIKSL